MNGQAPTKSIVALPGGGVAAFTASGQYYYHADHLGSTRLLTAYPSPTIRECDDYYPFAESISCGNTTGSTLKFTGDERDSESTLDHTLFRQYSSSLARWLHPDPAGLAAVNPTNPQSWNRYAYVMNNPLIWTDPSGLDPCPNDNTWGAQLCKAAQAFAGTSYYNTWNAFTVLQTALTQTGDVSATLAGVPIGDTQTIYTDLSLLDLLGGIGRNNGGNQKNKACKNGIGSGGVSIGAGYNLDAGAIVAGVSTTGGVSAGLFHNSAGGGFSGYSGGAAASGGVAAYAGSKVAGSPAQGNNVAFVLGGYAGVGPNVTFSNAASVQQTSGPFTTASINAGLGIANLGVQISFGGGIWQVSITPPLVSAGFGLAGSVITTNTITTQTGCK